MPTAPLRFCAEPGCPARVSQGRCHAHTRQESDRDNQAIRRLYRTVRWQRLRAQKFAEQPLCSECLAEGHTEPWTELDHVIPHRGNLMLFWDADNLNGLCVTHHARKTGQGQ